jgi:hypothetical protein
VLTQINEAFLTRLMAWSALLTTVLVTAWWTLEPVNAPKMVVLTSCSISFLFLLISSGVRFFNKEYRFASYLLVIFNLFLALSLAFSKDNVNINFYGATGRSSGFLTYFALTSVFLAATFLRFQTSYKRIIRYFFYAGVLNVIYCLTSIIWIDIFPWDNPYGNILGTFGNPNFVGSFLGFVGVGTTSYVLFGSFRLREKLLGLLLLGLCIFEIQQSRAIQGFVVLGLGVLMCGFFYLRSKLGFNLLARMYIVGAIVLGLIAVLGTLQIGPLQGLLYKTSVSLRGLYWKTGIAMGSEYPISGVGIDSYGTYFRKLRPESTLEWPGLGIITDAAHNVPIDLFAGGGYPVLALYGFLQLFVLVSAIKVVRRSHNYDPIFVTIFTIWICYQAQSLISINQIGLAIWGWLLGGLIVGFERCTRTANLIGNEQEKSSKKAKKKKNATDELVPAKVLLSSVMGFVIGFALAFPPVYSDLNWKSALDSKKKENLTQAAFTWPSNPERIFRTARILLNSKLTQDAYIVLTKGTEQFPESYILWFGRWQMQPESTTELSEIKSNLHRLDPLNPEFQ